jgi:hypothetical protein
MARFVQHFVALINALLTMYPGRNGFASVSFRKLVKNIERAAQ